MIFCCIFIHIPIEISRHVYFFLKLGGKLKVQVTDAKLCKSPVALKGLEILLDAKFTISQSQEKVIQRLQQHIKLYYDIENPALIPIKPVKEADDQHTRTVEDVQEEDQVAQDQEAEVAEEDLFVIDLE